MGEGCYPAKLNQTIQACQISYNTSAESNNKQILD